MKVLVVEDEAPILRNICRLIEKSIRLSRYTTGPRMGRMHWK